MPTMRDLLHTDMRTIGSSETLAEAARAFAGEVVGLLVVVENEHLVGVLSERDVVRAVGEGEDLSDSRVFDAMTEDVVTIDQDADADEAVRTMLDSEIRHLVVTKGRQPVGVVSSRDLLRVLAHAG